MRTVRGGFRIILAVALVAFWTIFTVTGACCRRGQDRHHYRAMRQRGGARLFAWVAGFRVTTKGEIPPAGPLLYVCNHITAVDPLIVATQVPVSFAGKAEIIRWPILGWIARSHGIIPVERGRRSSTGRFVDSVRVRLAKGVPVVVFPEGGIGWGDTLRSFKTGAFEAVAECGTCRLQPVFVDVLALNNRATPGAQGRHTVSYNHHDMLVAHLVHVLGFSRVDFQVRFGASVATDGLSRKVLAEKAQEAVEELQHQKP